MADSLQVSRFWMVVEECLITFHNLDPSRAAQKIADTRLKLLTGVKELNGRSRPPQFRNLIYHAEPWYIACNLAGNQISVDKHLPAYQKILSRIGSKERLLPVLRAQRFRPDKSLDALKATEKRSLTPRATSVARKIVPLTVMEKQAILNALKVANDDKLKAARLLGIGKKTLYRKLKEYGW